ncbi:hypothetical protein LB534_03335 [Mesorhizobium sp. CA18]|uniref:hypothetical protein n=1 Tax=unclassified Mesorhizobium TaxID=325217 RepID=UPI001CCBA99D|nr:MULTISPECIES: hypothetical protein [unclassified Mesorhizobium]MBZ9733645.1 hypothetical protein [Mesorhizobium sp. CA9]MBZ9765425.1 hypothetical protein [Mesorhizobium sp. CA6]MBZ9824310.1 hypothetical protein [Mesorhizobium sp. CA18]MBZ9831204.1 hypothetical protein [Mesorhizobium sp. CA2]MBZ9837368.1 hypothetical protein [Mesorhizobium sp. CA3]
MLRTVARPSRAFLPLLALALASCSSSETIDQQSKLAASTAQAAVLVSGAWLSGAAPSHYASSALQTFAETLAAGRQVESASPSDRGKRDSLVAAVTRLSNAARRAKDAVEAEQDAQVGQAQQELRAAQGDLAVAYRQYFAQQQ